ncbi:MAG: class I tRNA ligase family protein, partial [Ruminococcus sp.]|nr:class I tRNA ligase family protein [Ruminococcus sp.]
TLGWPEKTPDYDYFYPTSTLVTGYDIIFFWVIRMMFSGLENMGKVPFDTVLIHGLVRDSQGRKMSKSLGNGIDPLEVISEYGADALRFMLATGNSPGNDMRYIDDKVKAARNFANKLWNASRFIMMNLPEDFEFNGLPDELELEDKWLVNKFNQLAKEVNDNLDKYELGVASQKIYDFIWDVYCDWYIELTKPRIQAGGETMAKAQAVLVWAMQGMLKLLHPFMPFITEEIWQVLTNEKSMIILEAYPTYDSSIDYSAEEKGFEKVISAIKAVRNTRTEMNVPPSVKAKLFIETADAELFSSCTVFFEKLASASAVEIGEKFELTDCANAVTDSARIFIPMDELVDKEKEIARLEKEKAKVQKDIDFLSGKLNNPGFVAKAPAQLIEAEKAKLAKAEEKMAKIEQSIAAFKA